MDSPRSKSPEPEPASSSISALLRIDADPGAARFVSRELVQLSPYANLDDLGRSETDGGA
jgi:hypothetical protein